MVAPAVNPRIQKAEAGRALLLVDLPQNRVTVGIFSKPSNDFLKDIFKPEAMNHFCGIFVYIG